MDFCILKLINKHFFVKIRTLVTCSMTIEIDTKMNKNDFFCMVSAFISPYSVFRLPHSSIIISSTSNFVRICNVKNLHKRSWLLRDFRVSSIEFSV